MRKSCVFDSLSRRDFLKIGGSFVALGSFLTTGVWAETANVAANFSPIEKKKTKIVVLFVHPSKESGGRGESKKNRQKYARKITDVAKTHDIDIAIQSAMDTRTAMDDFVGKMKVALPDTLVVVNFCNTFSQWTIDTLEQLAQLPMIVYHPVGSPAQHSAAGLLTAPGVIYLSSPENWDALENAIVAANAKKMMAQSRLLRINNSREILTEKDKHLGVEIITVPLTEYDALFHSIKADDALIREAMAFKAKASAVIDVEDNYFVDAFRAQKAVHEMIRRYGVDALTIRCFDLKERRPCIAFSLFNSALIPCACEDFPDSTMSMMLGVYLFKRGGFLHNPAFDINRNQYCGSHCTCPLEMKGPGKGELPFSILPFPHNPPRTTAMDVKMPSGEKMFVMKYIPPENMIFAYTGTMIYSPDKSIAGDCETRFAMDIDKIDDVRSIHHGPHPILYCGTEMEAKRIKDFATLAQLEFIGNV